MLKHFLLLFVLLLGSPVWAGGNHQPPPSQPPIQDVPQDGSSHNAIALALVIAAGICIYHKCWQEQAVKDSEPNRVTPEPPTNEYLRIKKQ